MENASVLLAGNDQRASSFGIPTAWRFETLLDYGVMRNGLEETLKIYPEFGGRLLTVNSKETGGKIVKIDRLGSGVRFDCVDVDEDNMPPPPDTVSTEQDWIHCGYKESVKLYDMDKEFNEEPLVEAKLYLFKSRRVSILSFTSNHALGDRSSILAFSKRWSYECGKLVQNLKHCPEQCPMEPPKSRITKPMEMRCKTKAELKEAWTSPHGTPFDILEVDFPELFADLVPVEIHITSEQAKNLKSFYSSKLSLGEWFSTSEMLSGLGIFLNSTVLKMDAGKPLKVATVLDGRRVTNSPYGPQGYVGNCTAKVFFEIGAKSDAISAPDWLLELIKQVHRNIREFMANGAGNIRDRLDWFNIAVNELGLLAEIQDQTLAECFEGIVNVNSIAPLGLFDLDFGSGIRPSAFGDTGPIRYPNMVRIRNRTPDLFSIGLAVRKSELGIAHVSAEEASEFAAEVFQRALGTVNCDFTVYT